MMKSSFLVVFQVLCLSLLVHAHIRMNSVNGVAGTRSSRNNGRFDASTDPCGQGGAIGTNGFTNYTAGDIIRLEWEVNNHPARGVFKISLGNTDSELEPTANPPSLVPEIPHEGPKTYQATVQIPVGFSCAQCTLQVWHTEHEWGTCQDIRVKALGSDGKTSKDSSTKSDDEGMNGAEKFFLGLFLFLLIASFLAIVVFFALVVARRKNVLPDGKLSDLVEKAEQKTRVDRITFSRGNTAAATTAAATTTATTAPAPAPAHTSSVAPSLPPKKKAKLQIGATVQARYSADGQYYNATIIDMRTDRILVNYVDYGEQEWLPISAIRS